MSPSSETGSESARSARRHWARAAALRLGLLFTAAAAGAGVYVVVDSAWLAWAVALFVVMNVWSLYLFVRYRNAPTLSAGSGGSNSSNADDDEQAARRAAYQKVGHDLFPLASRPLPVDPPRNTPSSRQVLVVAATGG